MSTATIMMVKDFHESMGGYIKDPAMSWHNNLPDEVLFTRFRLITEEYAELVIALHENEIIEIADALSDLLYVVMGAGVEYGLHLDDGFIRPDGEPHTMPAWVCVDVLFELSKTVNIALDMMRRGTIVNVKSLNTNLQRLVHSICITAGRFNIPLRRCVAEVHRSNMTKEPLNEHRKGGKGENFSPAKLEPVLWDNKNWT